MAFTKKSWQDYLAAAFGQVNQPTKSGSNYLVVGGRTETALGTVVIPTSDTVTSGTLAASFSGLLRNVTLVTPAMTGTGTATMTLVDSLGGTPVALAGQDESVTTNYGTIQPIGTAMEWVVTANGTQDAAATVTFAAHYEQ
jgi:hypothetical protein